MGKSFFHNNLSSEKTQLAKVAEGNELAFKELFNHYQPLLLSFVFRFSKSTAIAEEIVQDVFLKIWLTRESLAGIESFKNYLFVVCRNHALNCVEKQLRLNENETAYIKSMQQNMVVEANGTHEPLPFHLIDQAIEQLPTQQKTAWLLSRHQGLTYVQIANKMGLSPKTVKRYIRLAVDSIKVYIVNKTTVPIFFLLVLNYF